MGNPNKQTISVVADPNYNEGWVIGTPLDVYIYKTGNGMYTYVESDTYFDTLAQALGAAVQQCVERMADAT